MASPARPAEALPAGAPADWVEVPKKKTNWVPLIVCLSLLLFCCCLAVPAALIALLLPGLQRVRDDNMAVMSNMNNMSQCAKAVHLAHDNNKKFPPYYGPYGAARANLSFHTHLLQYVDQIQVYNAIVNPQLNQGGGGLAGGATNAIIPAYVSSLDPTQTGGGAGACNFPVNLRLYYTLGGLGELIPVNTPYYPKMPQAFKQDGIANTLLFATKYMNCGNGGSHWYDTNAQNSPTAAHFGVSMNLWQRAPTQIQCNPLLGTAVSFGPQNIQVAMCDASVRIVSVGISAATWQAVHTPNAGDVVGADWDN